LLWWLIIHESTFYLTLWASRHQPVRSHDQIPEPPCAFLEAGKPLQIVEGNVAATKRGPKCWCDCGQWCVPHDAFTLSGEIPKVLSAILGHEGGRYCEGGRARVTSLEVGDPRDPGGIRPSAVSCKILQVGPRPTCVVPVRATQGRASCPMALGVVSYRANRFLSLRAASTFSNNTVLPGRSMGQDSQGCRAGEGLPAGLRCGPPASVRYFNTAKVEEGADRRHLCLGGHGLAAIIRRRHGPRPGRYYCYRRQNPAKLILPRSWAADGFSFNPKDHDKAIQEDHLLDMTEVVWITPSECVGNGNGDARGVECCTQGLGRVDHQIGGRRIAGQEISYPASSSWFTVGGSGAPVLLAR